MELQRKDVNAMWLIISLTEDTHLLILIQYPLDICNICQSHWGPLDLHVQNIYL